MKTYGLSSPLLVFGLGQTGLAVARWALSQGCAVTVLDSRQNPPEQAAWEALCTQYPDLTCSVFGAQVLTDAKTLLPGHSTLVVAPGLSPYIAPLKVWLKEAQAQGVRVVSEIELFALALQGLQTTRNYHPKVIAVTGTNGKTTVTSLCTDMVNQAGLKAVSCGNISPCALDALMTHWNDLPDVWVLELSSFQLFYTFNLHADAATVLNVTQDHLDWHADMDEYARTKATLVQKAKVAVLNRADPLVMAMCSGAKVRSFGLDMPPLEGDMGVVEAGGIRWLSLCEPDTFALPETSRPRRSSDDAESATRSSGHVSRMMPVESLKMMGAHNVQNALASLLLCHHVGIALADLLPTLRTFQAPAHRCEFVRSVQGVDFMDDSKGTNVGATLVALEGMGRTCIPILGGVGKGQDFKPLTKPLREHARHIILMGQDASVIAQDIADAGVPMTTASSMDDAVRKAFEVAQEGDLVLLSPACASFDMFKGYHHRGLCFVDAVEELAHDQGEV